MASGCRGFTNDRTRGTISRRYNAHWIGRLMQADTMTQWVVGHESLHRCNGMIAILLFVSGCATKPVLAPVKYEYLDVPAERRIEVTYRNTSQHPMCLLPELWPNQAGKINQASDKVFLVVGQERFPIEDFNTGYCIGDCATRVAPGRQVSSSIAYVDFRLPDRLIDARKELDFSPMAFRCPR